MLWEDCLFEDPVATAKGREYQNMHPAKLTFQALRIHLNEEFAEMRRGMGAAFALLGAGGRIGLITWKHSECAIVVDAFRRLEAVRAESPLAKWWEEGALATLFRGTWATLDPGPRTVMRCR